MMRTNRDAMEDVDRQGAGYPILAKQLTPQSEEDEDEDKESKDEDEDKDKESERTRKCQPRSPGPRKAADWPR